MTERRMAAPSLVRLLGNWYQEESRLPAYQQLSRSLQLLILDGRLPLNVQLPSERALASELSISRTTLAAALSLLREQSFLASRQGSGSVTLLPEGQPSKSQVEGAPPIFDLSTASLSAGPEISQAYATALEALPEHLSSTGYDSQGLLSLRETIAERYCQRGLKTEPGQIMVINGAVSGLGLILRLLTGPGDRVVVDHPTYPMAIAAIRGASCRPIPVSLPDRGWDITGLEATCAQTAPRLAYLIPDFHNPTGRCMDSETRQRLATAIAKSRTTLVVDETMVDLWYDAPPPPPMAAFAGEDDVITLGSSGKTFWGGMRLGWIRASKKTIDALIQVRGTLDLGTPLMEQLATIALFNRQHAFMPARRAMLQARRDACSQLMKTLFPQWITMLPTGGLSWWIELPKPLATLFAVHAESTGIRLASGPHFGIDGAFERYFRLPFTLATSEMQHVLTELQPIWLELLNRGGRRLADSVL